MQTHFEKATFLLRRFRGASKKCKKREKLQSQFQN